MDNCTHSTMENGTVLLKTVPTHKNEQLSERPFALSCPARRLSTFCYLHPVKRHSAAPSPASEEGPAARVPRLPLSHSNSSAPLILCAGVPVRVRLPVPQRGDAHPEDADGAATGDVQLHWGAAGRAAVRQDLGAQSCRSFAFGFTIIYNISSSR